jgi:erythromycin esterase-like protein
MIDVLDSKRLRDFVSPLQDAPADLNAVLENAERARYVLIGEATHGTHEFYALRAQITKGLIERGFCAVAVEGDWPDAHRVHRYVCGTGSDATAIESLGGFERFPVWMWRNADVVDFLGWLRSHNDGLPLERRVGFYGLDLYSLHRSMHAVVAYLETVDPQAADRARERFSCFDRFGDEVEGYARTVGYGLSPSCREEALAQLLEMQRHEFSAASAGATTDGERRFVAEQNARVVASAEAYYRTMLDADISSWNMRDEFMYETLERLHSYLAEGRSLPAKIVVWAHNSHVGDASATSMGGGRELNLGQLVRRYNGRDSRLIGLTTSQGTVTAASRWHGDPERKGVRPPAGGSWEALFHAVGVPNFYLDLKRAASLYPALATTLLERAIGVLYLPQTELHSHYLYARIAEQFDAIFHLDHTRAVEPLDRGTRWDTGEVPETFPSGV